MSQKDLVSAGGVSARNKSCPWGRPGERPAP